MLFAITAFILRILFSLRATTSANSLETHSPRTTTQPMCCFHNNVSDVYSKLCWTVHMTNVWPSTPENTLPKPPLPALSSCHPLFLQLLSLLHSFAKPYCLVVWVSQIVTIRLFLTNYLHPSPLTGRYLWHSTCKNIEQFHTNTMDTRVSFLKQVTPQNHGQQNFCCTHIVECSMGRNDVRK
jgi:hypothetical protein